MDDAATGTTVELIFEVGDESCFFVAASGVLECRVVGEEAIHRTDGSVLEYFTVAAPAHEVLDAAEAFDGVESARVVDEYDGECLLELVSDGDCCVSGTLADTRAVVTGLHAEDGEGVVTAELYDHGNVRAVVEAMRETYPGTELRSKAERDRRRFPSSGPESTARLLDRLTTRQRDAVRTAVRGGYLAWPRRSTASECAEALGVSQPTFSQHLYRGLEILLGGVFEAEDRTVERPRGEP